MSSVAAALKRATAGRGARVLAVAVPVLVGLGGALLALSLTSAPKTAAALAGLVAAAAIAINLEVGLFALVTLILSSRFFGLCTPLVSSRPDFYSQIVGVWVYRPWTAFFKGGTCPAQVR